MGIRFLDLSMTVSGFFTFRFWSVGFRRLRNLKEEIFKESVAYGSLLTVQSGLEPRASRCEGFGPYG